jgi:outer membrane protein assembly factor BamB
VRAAQGLASAVLAALLFSGAFGCAPSQSVSTTRKAAIAASSTVPSTATAELDGVLWPTSGGDPQNTRRSCRSGPNSPGLEWRSWVKPSGPWGSSPVVGRDHTVYVGDIDGLHALGVGGEHKWTFATRDEVDASPAVGSDGTIYVGCVDGMFYSVNPDGTQKWSRALGKRGLSSAAIGSDGTIYVASAEGKLLAISPAGKTQWAFEAPGRLPSVPDEGIWSSTGPPAVGKDGTVYVAGLAFGRRLFAVAPGGKSRWSVRMEDCNIFQTPVIADDGAIYLDGCVVKPDGTKRPFPARGLIYSSLAIGRDGTVYAGGAFGLKAFRADGTKKWELSVEAMSALSPAVGADGTVYYATANAKAPKVYALRSDGTAKWVFDIDDPAATGPTIGADGTLYIGSWGGLLAIGDAK